MTNLTLFLVVVILLHMTNCRMPLVNERIWIWGTDNLHRLLQFGVNLLGDGDLGSVRPRCAPGWSALGMVIEVVFH